MELGLKKKNNQQQMQQPNQNFQQPDQQAVNPQVAQQALQPIINTDNEWMKNAMAQTRKQQEADQKTATENMIPKKEEKKKPEEHLKRFKYVILNDYGRKEKGNFDAAEENEVRSYLISQGYQVISVAERDKTDIDLTSTKFKASDLSFMLTQLSTYIKSGITLADSVKMLAKQATKPGLKKNFNQVVYHLLRGDSLSQAMEKQENVFPKMLINMVQTAEMTGDLPSILDDMAEYYTSMDQTRKQMKSAMIYPAVVLTLAFGVLIFMLTYLVPQFSSMFEDNGSELPALTQTILNLSGFVKQNYLILLIVVLVLVVGFIFCYKKIQPFRRNVQLVLMKLPVVKNIIIYNEIANFTKTFASLLNHGVFITDSMEILSKVTNNEIYKEIINDTLVNLAKGDTISTAFKGKWAIPIIAYEMIVTGETTGQLGTMMEKVAAHFQNLHKNTIDQMKSLIEPIMIVVLAGIVGIILISIVQPMFSIYSSVQ